MSGMCVCGSGPEPADTVGEKWTQVKSNRRTPAVFQTEPCFFQELLVHILKQMKLFCSNKRLVTPGLRSRRRSRDHQLLLVPPWLNVFISFSQRNCFFCFFLIKHHKLFCLHARVTFIYLFLNQVSHFTERKMMKTLVKKSSKDVCGNFCCIHLFSATMFLTFIIIIIINKSVCLSNESLSRFHLNFLKVIIRRTSCGVSPIQDGRHNKVILANKIKMAAAQQI